MHPASQWNNPEPEVVLVVSSDGRIVGASLGNDVNLRDIEGRSALLLGKAKDNNASASVGPFVRLFDASYDLDALRASVVRLSIDGEDGYRLDGHSELARISRDPADLVEQVVGAHHQYPDGFVLYLGTMFAPVDDRDVAGRGFTHHDGDLVRIAEPAPRRPRQSRALEHRGGAVDLRHRRPLPIPHHARPAALNPEEPMSSQNTPTGDLASTLVSTDPRTGEAHPTGTAPTSIEATDAAVQAAQAAFERARWNERGWRAGLLEALADGLDARRAELVAIADRETGLGTARLDGEVSRSAFQFRLFAEALRDGGYLEVTIDHGGATALGPAPELRRMLVPIGPVAVFGSSNFPFAFSVAGGDTASALAGGNAVVLKAHSSHLETSCSRMPCSPRPPRRTAPPTA